VKVNEKQEREETLSLYCTGTHMDSFSMSCSEVCMMRSLSSSERTTWF
jgi:hypothetical protein